MMVFEGGTGARRELVHCFAKIQNPKSKRGSMDTPKLVQFCKSKQHAILTSTESTFRSFRIRRRFNSFGLIFPEAQSATRRSCNSMIEITLQKVMNYRIIDVLRKLARHSRKRNRILSDRSEDFTPIGDSKNDDILACEKIEGHTLESSISKLTMMWARHLDQQDRELDGAVHWKSRLRHAFQEQGERTFSDSDRTNCIWKGSNDTRFPIFQELPRRSTPHSRHSRAHWRGRDPAGADGSCRHSTPMEGILVSLKMLFEREINPRSRTHHRWKGKQRTATNRILHPIGPLVRRARRTIQQRLFEAEKSAF